MKRFAIFLLTICMLIPCMAFTAAAEERTINVTFNIVDDTQGVFGEDLTVSLVARNTTDRAYECVFKASENYPEQTVSVAYGYTYDVMVSYPSQNTGAYHIITRSGGEIMPFNTAEGDLLFNWLIIKVGGEDMPTSDEWLEAEAPIIWAELLPYLEQVTEDNPDFQYTFEQLANFEDVYAGEYEFATGRPAGDWYRYTPEEQFLLRHAYILPMDAVASDLNSEWWGESDNFVTKLAANSNFRRKGTLVTPTNEIQLAAEEAYKTFAEWMWTYYRTHGEMYLFVPELLNRFYTMPEETLVQTEPPTEPVPTASKIEPTEPVEEAETTPADESDGEGVRDSWLLVWKQLSKNGITITLLVVCGGLLLYIKRIKKLKNMDD